VGGISVLFIRIAYFRVGANDAEPNQNQRDLSLPVPEERHVNRKDKAIANQLQRSEMLYQTYKIHKASSINPVKQAI
jgi:hypothetical protein